MTYLHCDQVLYLGSIGLRLIANTIFPNATQLTNAYNVTTHRFRHSEILNYQNKSLIECPLIRFSYPLILRFWLTNTPIFRKSAIGKLFCAMQPYQFTDILLLKKQFVSQTN